MRKTTVLIHYSIPQLISTSHSDLETATFWLLFVFWSFLLIFLGVVRGGEGGGGGGGGEGIYVTEFCLLLEHTN